MFLSPQKQLEHILSQPRVHLAVKLSGKYKLQVLRAGQLVRETDWFDNMILDQGLKYLGDMSLLNPSAFPNGPMGYCQVGTGTTPVAATDTQLANYLIGTVYSNSSFYEAGTAPNYECTMYQYYSFPQGGIIKNITEVGIGRTQSTGSLFSRALLINSFGVATPLEITAEDQLIVVYALTYKPRVTATTGAVFLEGNPYDWQGWMMNLTNLGTATGNMKLPCPNNNRPFLGFATPTGAAQCVCHAAGTPMSPTILTDSTVPNSTGSASITSTGANSTYSFSSTGGVYTATSSITIAPAVGNLPGGIQGVVAQFCLTDQASAFNVFYRFNNAVPKTAAKLMKLAFTATWSR